MTFLAILGLMILLGLSVFQILLILGRPLGEYAWGGQQRILPTKLRIASSFSVILYVLFALFLASAAFDMNFIAEDSLLKITMWIFTGYFILGVFMNAISRNKKERYTMTPVALVLAVVFLVTTLSY